MRVLMLPHYSEPLRVLRVPAEAARRRGHDVTIVNVCRLGNDRKRVSQLLHDWDEPVHMLHADAVEPNPGGAAELGPASWFVHPGRRLDVLRAVSRPRMRSIAQSLMDTHRPDVVVLANEHMPFLAEFVDVCNGGGPPTVCFQWTIANASVRHTLEMYNRMPGGAIVRMQREPEQHRPWYAHPPGPSERLCRGPPSGVSPR